LIIFQAGAKPILEALHKDANDAFNSFRNIEKVVDKIIELRQSGRPDGSLDVGVSLMHPVQPMLAMACKSVDMAFQKCPNGLYSGNSQSYLIFNLMLLSHTLLGD
jgi:DNA ligase-3